MRGPRPISDRHESKAVDTGRRESGGITTKYRIDTAHISPHKRWLTGRLCGRADWQGLMWSCAMTVTEAITESVSEAVESIELPAVPHRFPSNRVVVSAEMTSCSLLSGMMAISPLCSASPRRACHPAVRGRPSGPRFRRAGLCVGAAPAAAPRWRSGKAPRWRRSRIAVRFCRGAA